MFKNMDRIIDAINQYTELGATARYTSLSDYVEHVSNLNSSWITREKDFFPYADGGDSYWTGIFYYFFIFFFQFLNLFYSNPRLIKSLIIMNHFLHNRRNQFFESKSY